TMGAAPIGHALRRELVELPAIAELRLRPGELDDLHLLFEQLTICAVTGVAAPTEADSEHGRLALDGAAAGPEQEASAAHDAGYGEILGQAERMPAGHLVKHRAEFEPLGVLGQDGARQQGVR